MDQHADIRVTTTVPEAGTADSENDRYVLDADTLGQQGNVTGMRVTERVYSVRYVHDTAHVVTFRRIDPFHVVGLSDPGNPEEVGELELPGFSSYLHPVGDSRIHDRGWSAVGGSHHASLIDRKHGVFVLPAGGVSWWITPAGR